MKLLVTVFLFYFCASVGAQSSIDSIIQNVAMKHLTKFGLTEDNCIDSLPKNFSWDMDFFGYFSSPVDYYCRKNDSVSYLVEVVQKGGVTGYIIVLSEEAGVYNFRQFEIILGSERLVAFRAMGKRPGQDSLVGLDVFELFYYDRRKAQTEIWTQEVIVSTLHSSEFYTPEPKSFPLEENFTSKIRYLVYGNK